MSGDPGDLANLADLALPAPVPLWPPAAGIWIVAVTVAAMVAVAAWRAVRRHRADAYLRSAAAELEALKTRRPGDGRDVAEAVSTVLKRAAMVTYGRERVASLSGAAWASFLAETAPQAARADALVARLRSPFARVEAVGAGNDAAFIAQAETWLRGQRGRISKEA